MLQFTPFDIRAKWSNSWLMSNFQKNRDLCNILSYVHSYENTTIKALTIHKEKKKGTWIFQSCTTLYTTCVIEKWQWNPSFKGNRTSDIWCYIVSSEVLYIMYLQLMSVSYEFNTITLFKNMNLHFFSSLEY